MEARPLLLFDFAKFFWWIYIAIILKEVCLIIYHWGHKRKAVFWLGFAHAVNKVSRLSIKQKLLKMDGRHLKRPKYFNCVFQTIHKTMLVETVRDYGITSPQRINSKPQEWLLWLVFKLQQWWNAACSWNYIYRRSLIKHFERGQHCQTDFFPSYGIRDWTVSMTIKLCVLVAFYFRCSRLI